MTHPAPESRSVDLPGTRSWRLLNSWWVLVPLLSLGYFGWLGFVIAAVRTRHRAYWFFAVGYAACLAIWFWSGTRPADSLPGRLVIVPFLASWIAPTVHALVGNRAYLRRLATRHGIVATTFVRSATLAPLQPDQQPRVLGFVDPAPEAARPGSASLTSEPGGNGRGAAAS